ncbi:MAG: hypothetical protein KAS47_00825 [Candidatus Heimdallarchaeota archaeon]|nr:hypothetical protein [Candidatus Heimdallarchaeota archaeon]MCK4972310.1 hypothetical protein [Candidatus Heimdallarchaeota archaeon]
MFVPKKGLKPSKEVLKKFGVRGELKLLNSGLKRCFKAGDIVLKYIPDTSEEEASWLPNLLNSIESKRFRVQKYLKSKDDKYREDGWVAYNFLSGELTKGRLLEKKRVLVAFHNKLKGVPKPSHLIEDRKDPWSTADKMVWDELPLNCHERILNAIQGLIKLRTPLRFTNQLIHGNPDHILFSETEPPAVIDLSWHWRPADFALAILAADNLVCWCKEGCDCLQRNEVVAVFEDVKHFKQLLVRAVLRRALELEGLRRFNERFLYEIDNHIPAINFVYDYVS